MKKYYVMAAALVVVCGCQALPSSLPRANITKATFDPIKTGMSQDDVISTLGRCADVGAPSSQGSESFWINNDKSRAVIRYDFDFHVISAEWQPAPGKAAIRRVADSDCSALVVFWFCKWGRRRTSCCRTGPPYWSARHCWVCRRPRQVSLVVRLQKRAREKYASSDPLSSGARWFAEKDAWGSGPLPSPWLAAVSGSSQAQSQGASLTATRIIVLFIYPVFGSASNDARRSLYRDNVLELGLRVHFVE